MIATKPGSCTKPLPGVVPEIVDDQGKPVEQGRGGWLVMAQPWPGMLRGIWGDDERYKEAYWSKVPHKYLAGDNSRCDSDGYYWIMGRIDDVLNVSGHRLSTIEVESALVSHPAVAEAAAVGRPDPIKGEAICVFVVVRKGEPSDELSRNCVSTSAKKSARWPSRTTCGSPTPCRRPAPARSCGGCCGIIAAGKESTATRARWKTSACWRNYAGTKTKRRAVSHLAAELVSALNECEIMTTAARRFNAPSGRTFRRGPAMNAALVSLWFAVLVLPSPPTVPGGGGRGFADPTAWYQRPAWVAGRVVRRKEHRLEDGFAGRRIIEPDRRRQSGVSHVLQRFRHEHGRARRRSELAAACRLPRTCDG